MFLSCFPNHLIFWMFCGCSPQVKHWLIYDYVVMAVSGSWQLSATLHTCLLKAAVSRTDSWYFPYNTSSRVSATLASRAALCTLQQWPADMVSSVQLKTTALSSQLFGSHRGRCSILTYFHSATPTLLVKVSLVFLVADSVNLHDPIIWPSLKGSALGFAEWMNARGT